MPSNKNHHFVPRFYLKHFSFKRDRKTVSIWGIDSESFIEQGSIKNQACGNHFYGEDPNLENAFGQLEGKVAPIIKGMIDAELLPKRESQEHRHLLAFVLSLALRTKSQADSVNEALDKLLKTIFKDDPIYKDVLDRVEINTKSAPILALGSLDVALPLCMGLTYKLLVNTSTQRFITSDNPVIRMNHLFAVKDPDGSHVGFASKGLQLLLPISPAMCLMFYDQGVYKVGNRKGSVVEVADIRDVEEANMLQYINADKALYFNDEVKKQDMQKLAGQARASRKKSKVTLNEYEVGPAEPNQAQSIIHLHPMVLSRVPKFSFAKLSRKARGYGNHPPRFRNPKLLDYLMEMKDKA